MKSSKENVVSSASLAAILIVFASPMAYGAADVSIVKPNAVDDKGAFCFILDGNGDPHTFTPADPQWKVRIKVVSSSDNLNFSCHLKNVPNDTGKTVTYDYENTDGALCVITAESGTFVTKNWQAVIAPSGQTVFSCHYNGQNK